MAVDASKAAAIIEQGSVFKVYFEGKGFQPPSAQNLFLFYQPMDRYGSLYLALQPDKSQKIQASCLPVHEIREILVGKTTNVLSSDLAANADSARCFAIRTQDAMLELEADTAEMAAAWQLALTTLMKTDLNKALRLMSDGMVCTRYIEGREGKEASKNEVFIFYKANEKKGVLYVSKVGSRVPSSDKETALLLNQITDVFKDKNAPAMKTDIAKEAKDTCCFSFKTTQSALHVEAADKTTRDAWLGALRTVLTTPLKSSSGPLSPRAESTAPINPMSPRGAVAEARAFSDAPITAPVSPVKQTETKVETRPVMAEPVKETTPGVQPVDVPEATTIRAGASSLQNLPTQANSGLEFAVRCWNLIKLDLLSKSDPVVRLSIVGSNRILSETEEVKDNHNPIFRKLLVLPPRPWNPDVLVRFSVYDKDVGALQEKDLMGFVEVPLEALFAFHFDPSYKTVVYPLNHPDASRNDALRKNKSTIGLTPRFASPISIISNGYQFTAFEKDSKREIFLFYERDDTTPLGAFYWCEPGNRAKSELRMPFNRISDVYMGKQHPVLQGSLATGIETKCCFSVATKQVGLHLAADHEIMRSVWLAAIKDVFQSGGKKVSDNQPASPRSAASPTAASSPAATNALMSPRAVAVQLDSKDPAAVLFTGSKFFMYLPNDPVERREVFVFYQPPEWGHTLGAMYWSAPGTREIKSENAFTLKSLTDVFLGKREATLQSRAAADASPKSCFSMISSVSGAGARAWHLEAPSDEFRTAWLKGLEAVINRKNGLDIVVGAKNLPASSASPIVRLYAADNDNKLLSETEAAKEGRNPSYETKLVFPGGGPNPNTRLRFTVANRDGPVIGNLSITYGDLSANVANELQLPLDGDEKSDVALRDARLTVRVSYRKTAVVAGNGVASPRGSQAMAIPTVNGVAEEDAEVKLVKSGVVVTAYLPNDRAVKLNVFFERDETKLGSLYWCQENSRQKVDNCSLPLSTITDVYLDKQTAIFQQPAAKNAIKDNSFTILSSAAHLNLEAPSKAVRDSWLRGLHKLLVTSGKKVVDNTPQLKAQKDAAELKSSAGRLVEGQVFHSYWKDGTHRDIFVFYEPPSDGMRLGALHWCPPGARTKSPDAVLSLARTSDLFIGKQTAVLKGTAAGDGRCFSIATKDGLEINLEADSSQTREAWLYGLHKILVSSGKKVVEESKAVAAGPKDWASYMIAGQRFAGYFMDESTKAVTKKDVVVFYEPDPEAKLGSLYWSAFGTKDKNGEARLPLNKIGDVFLGKRTATFAAVPAADANRCLSLKSRRLELNLEAPSTGERADFLEGLKALFHTAGKPVVDDNEKKAVSDNYKVIAAGGLMTAYTEEKGKMITQPIFAIYDPTVGKLGTVFFTDPSRRERKDAPGVAVHLISDMFIGKHAPVFRNTEAEGGRCFSIVAVNGQMHLSVGSENERNAWIYGLHEILRSAGKKVVDSKDEKKRGIPAGLGAANGQVVPYDEAAMKNGFVFTAFFTDGSAVTRREINLFYDVEDDLHLGKFYWCDVGQRDKNESRALHLDKLTDMYLGKHIAVFTHPSTVDLVAEQCCSIVSTQAQLHLAAPSAAQRDSWLFGITVLLKAYTKRIDTLLAEAAARGLDIQVACRNLMGRTPLAILSDAATGAILAQTEEVHNEPNPTFQRRLAYPKGAAPAPDRKLRFSVYDVATATNTLTDNELIGYATFTFVDLVKMLGRQSVFSLRNDTNAVKNGSGAAIFLTATLPSAPPLSTEQMMAGLKFRGFFLRPDGSVFPSDVMVVYRSDEQLGSLYWFIPGEQPREDQRLHLDHVTDLYLGKQTGVLKDIAASAADPACCCSIVAEGAELHLEAPSPELRESWLYGVQHLLMAHGKRVVDKDKHEDGEPGALSAELLKQLANKKPAILALPLESIVKHLSNGSKFKAHIGGSRQDMLVFYGNHGTIYYSDAKQEKDYSRGFPLQDVTEVVIGKTGAFSGDAAEDRCFSLITGKDQLNLEAESVEQLAAWLFGVRRLLESQNKVADEEAKTEEKAAKLRRFKISAQGEKKTSTLGASGEQLLSILTRGAAFTHWAQFPDAANKPLRLSFDSSSQELFWEDGKTGERLGSCKPGELTEVYVGKQTQLLQWAAESAERARFVTLFSKKVVLNLEASEEQLSAWLLGLSQILESAGRTIYSMNEESSRFVMIDTPPKLAEQTQPRGPVVKSPDALSGRFRFVPANTGRVVSSSPHFLHLAGGFNFTWHNGRGKGVFIWASATADQASLHWCTQEQRSARPVDPYATIPFGAIIAASIGQTGQGSAASVSPDVLITLHCERSDIILEAASTAERDRFLGALCGVKTTSGSSIRQEDPLSEFLERFQPVLPMRGGDTRGVPVRADANLAVDSKDYDSGVVLNRMLQKGQVFKGYAKKGRRDIIKEVFLFHRVVAENKDDQFGSLYWCEPGEPANPAVDRRLPITEFHDVFLGKQSPVLRELAASVDSDRCFSITGEDECNLDLEAASAEQVIAWSVALGALLKQRNAAKK